MTEFDGGIKSVTALLAERDRYRKALQEIDELIEGTTSVTYQIKKITQRALKCK